ncbi:Nuclear speckle splicing regulatory protein 1 [Lamellibrachia satsuma]|nr:Nuclear speckle splicing regulatory protein 1 [Lamellibrachia satsuma]
MEGFEDPQVAVNQMIGKESTKAKLKRQTQMQIEAALTQDPTVYEYDSVYDSLHPNEQKKKVTKPEDRKAKYMGNLMKAAEARKKEYERRVERQVQKEREAEQGMYDDKEEFVTEAYKRKMQEQQKEEEQERRQDQMEEHHKLVRDFVFYFRDAGDAEVHTTLVLFLFISLSL